MTAMPNITAREKIIAAFLVGGFVGSCATAALVAYNIVRFRQ